MRSPVAALLWESWRLTRVEMVFRMALAIIVGGAPLLVSSTAGNSGPMTRANSADGAAAASLFLIACIAMPFWFGIALLKGGRPIDGGAPGFPFTMGYPRPVSTAFLVGVPMTYFALAAAAAYVVPAVVLGAIFGYAFPLGPFAAWIVALSLAQAATAWWTHSKTVQLAGSMSVVGGCLWLIFRQLNGEIQPPAQWPTQFAFSFGDYGTIGSIAAASIALSIASVARQRHGDISIPGKRAASTVWLGRPRGDVVRFACPTSTPARAQWWVEVRRSGASLLVTGLGLALAIPALVAAFGAWERAQLLALSPVMLAPLVVLHMGIDNVFGLQRKPGRTYAGTFDASQPIGTVRLVTIKVLVRAGCFLCALAVLAVSFWVSVPLLDGWSTILPTNYDALISGRRAVAAAMEALTDPQRVALAVVIVTGVSTTVAHAASLQVFRLLHPMRVFAVSLALLAYTVMFLLWSRQASAGIEVVIMEAYPLVLAATISLSTLHVFRLALGEQLITARHAVAAVLLWMACGVSWLTLTQGGLDLAAMPLASVALLLSLSLLPATAVALTPWAYSLVRHR
jgi:hypothetical protein